MCPWIAPCTRTWKRARFGCEFRGCGVLEVHEVFGDLELLRVKVLGVCSVALMILQDSFQGQLVTKEKECI